MILDVMNNIERYAETPDIYIALKKMVTLEENIEFGTYEISENVKLIVSEYMTKLVNPNKFEAHTKYIDIQFPLIGYEKVEWHNLTNMEKITRYDEIKDRAYYIAQENKDSFVIGGNKFAIFYPEDSHNPCLCINNKSEKVKKATFKIKAIR